MTVLLSVIKEIWGLFVEDGSYAFAIVAWLGVVGLGVTQFSNQSWRGPLLFAGLAVVMLENVWRTARSKRAGRG